MLSPLNIAAGLVLSVALLAYISQRFHRKFLDHLPGPRPGTWLVGNLPDLTRPMNVGDAEFSWTRQFGNALKIKGAFGSDILFVTDPKALQHILNTSGYSYPKSPEIRAMIHPIVGRGLSWSEGTQHAKQRKIMNPAFSYDSLRIFLPLFQHIGQQTVVKWRDIITESGASSLVLDIPMWLSRVTLDAIGATAFDYDFGALNGEKNELSEAYHNLFADSFFEPSDGLLAMCALPAVLPGWITSAIQLIPNKQSTRLRNYMRIARRVAKSLVDRQLKAHAAGQDRGKDVMSILVEANLAENPKNALSEEEILSQMTTLMLAGHETTASTITWALYELSQTPELQKELREEIKAARAQAQRRGRNEFTISDLDSMDLLNAVVKETLRFHPTLPRLERVTTYDDVIPLSTPVVAKTGKLIHEIPISKGQRVFISLAAYNRLKSVWGEDANMWRPKRFLEGLEKSQPTNIGVLANIGSFSSGTRNCIGWRFSVVELQALLVELVENFEFLPPPGNVEIRRAAVFLMTPMVKGSTTGRTELPLTVKCVM